MRKPFFIKLFNWEYWPFGIVQLPLFFLWIFYALRERSLFYFSASNPGILAGGMMGESKAAVLDLVPTEVKPKTVLIRLPASLEDILVVFKTHGFSFPVIFKPDLGERGWMVRKINSEGDVMQYLSEIRIDFIVQELVDLPLEFGVFYVRLPSQQNGLVNSITMKEFLSVTGDGKKTLRDLIMENGRACLQWPVLSIRYQEQLRDVLKSGERLELVSIGNHCLGTKFLNGNHLITPKLSASFDAISKKIDGFYFGRFDLRAASVEDLERGNVKIVELNGCGAEPAHIYHPGSSLWNAVTTLITHWNNMYRISKENHQRGTPYLSFAEGRKIFRTVRQLK